MQTEIKLTELKLINWKQLDDWGMKYLKTTLIMNAVMYSSIYLYKGLVWWMGV